MTAIFDKAHAIEQAGGNADLALDLHTMLLTELPELYDKLTHAQQQMNYEAMWDHAHKIYGSTAYCGVPALKQAAGELEKVIKAKEENQLADAISQVENEIVSLLTERDEILAQLG